MAQVWLKIMIYGSDYWWPGYLCTPDILTVTINGMSKTLTCNWYWWETESLQYEEDTKLDIVVRCDPPYHYDTSRTISAASGSFLLTVTPKITSIYSFWTMGIRPTTLGAPVSFVDEVPLVLTPAHILHKLDEVNVDDIKRIDEIYVLDGTWHVDARSTDVGLDWVVTVTA